jgi:O-Antigen ligase
LLLFLALAGSGALLVLAFVLRPSGGHGLDDLTREWSAAWTMIRDHFWLGVGPGNYGRVYPQYMDPTAPTFARQPDSFILEVWATLGLPALLALGVALVNFFRRTLSVVPGQGQGTEDEGSVTRWEFYEGGMIGLVIGFLLRALPAGPDAIKHETVDAVVRAIVWFAVFALIQGIRWSGATRVLACTAGVAALLLHLAVSGGFFVPGVAQPLLILAALALNGLPEKPVPVGHQIAGRVVPLALATAAALLCALQLFQPLTNAQSDNRTALAMGQKFLDVKSGVTRTLADGKTERLKPPDEVLPLVITFLEKSVQSDPGNASYWVNLADWYGTLYEENPKNDDYRLRGLKYALAAQQRDPFGQGGYLAESRLHQLGAAHAPTLEIRRQEVADSPAPLLKIVESRKYDAQLHYRLAVVFFGAGQPGAGKEHATRALKLDEAAPTLERRLTDPQRQQAKRFLGGP